MRAAQPVRPERSRGSTNGLARETGLEGRVVTTANALEYTVAVYDAEEGGYWAEVLDSPGCVAQGETLDALRAELPEAITAYLETKRELGEEPEPPRAFTWSLRIEGTDLASVS